jgi:hypothetical protein
MYPIKNIENEISKRLLKAHLDASYVVYSTIKKFKLMQRKKYKLYQL